MKKKVALLLVLTMILSMLPMNVFGARGTITGDFTGTGNRSFTVSVDAVDFRSRATTPAALFIEFTTTDANIRYQETGLGYEGGASAWVQSAGAPLDDFTDWLNAGEVRRWSNNRLTIELPEPPTTISDFDAGGLGGRVMMDHLSGVFTNNIRIYTQNADARLTVRLMGVDERGNVTTFAVLADRNLVEGADPGVTISAAAAVPLVGAARVPAITITENRAGALAPVRLGGAVNWGRHAVRLQAPRGFVWVDGSELTAIGGDDFYVWSDDMIADVNIEEFIHVPPVNGRDTIIVDLSVHREASALVQAAPASIQLRNLWLVATETAPSTGTAYVAVEFGHFAVWGQGPYMPSAGSPQRRLGWHGQGSATLEGSPSFDFDDMTEVRNGELVFVNDSREDMPSTLTGGFDEVRNPNYGRPMYSWHNGSGTAWGMGNRGNSDWRNLNLPVALLGATALIEVEEYGDRAELVSGDWQYGFGGTIRMTESVPSTMLRGVETYTFRLVQPGVHFADVEWRADEVNGGRWHRQSRNWRTPVGYDETGHLPGTTFGARSVTLMPNPQDAIGSRRNLDFRFNLSVEAGFAQRYDEIEVDVIIFPHGIVERVTLATVTDPISVSATEPNRIWRPTAAGFDYIPPTQIPNVTVTESEYGTFQTGDLIWLHVVSTHADTGLPATLPLGEARIFTGENPIISDDSGLVLRHIGWGETVEAIVGTGSTANPQHPGSGINAHLFAVDAPSYGEPATITFINNFVEGMFPSGVDIQFVVGGSRISRNSQAAVRSNSTFADVPEEELPSPAFDGMTFAARVLEVRTAVDEVEPPPGWGEDPVVTPPPRELPGPLVLYPGMSGVWSPSTQETIPHPVITHGGVTRIALRVFANHIGADIIEWTADRVVILSAIAVNGERMTVHLPAGSNVATIIYNDLGVVLENVDMATWVNNNSPTGASSGPAGSVQTVIYNNFTYLPARFLAYVFGFDVSWANQVTTITPRV
jgi:hypothetical protein